MVEREPTAKKKKRKFRGTSLILSGSLVLASASVCTDILLATHVIGRAAAGQALPDDPCTQLQPFGNSGRDQRALARECLQTEQGKIVIVDFTGLGKKDEKAIAGYTQQFLRQSSEGILSPDVVSIPASAEARRTFMQTAYKPVHGCVPVPDVQDTPSAIAIKTMPEVRKYPHAFVISLAPQKACDVGGLAYDGNTIATVYPENIVNSGENHDQSVASDVAHEGSHLYNLDHANIMTFGSDNVSGSPRYPKEMISFKLSKVTPGGEVGNIMGQWDSGYIAAFDPIQEDILRWPKAILDGKNVLMMRQFGPKQQVALSEKEIENGHYAMTELAEPLSLPVGDDDKGNMQYGKFDRIAILPALSGDHLWKGSDSYTLHYMLFDSQKTHDTAYVTDAAEVFMNGNLTVTIEGNQVIHIVGTKKGLSFQSSLN